MIKFTNVNSFYRFANLKYTNEYFKLVYRNLNKTYNIYVIIREHIVENKKIYDENYINRIVMLGLNISYYRKLRGLTQEELAELVGISRVHLSKIEAPNMEFTLSIRLLFDIADALKIEPWKLLVER